MIEIEIDWIQNKAFVKDNKRRQYGVVSISGMTFVNERDLKYQIICMWEKDEVNKFEEIEEFEVPD